MHIKQVCLSYVLGITKPVLNHCNFAQEPETLKMQAHETENYQLYTSRPIDFYPLFIYQYSWNENNDLSENIQRQYL